MAIEIERKFLVHRMPDLRGLEGTPMVQGYLRADAGGSVRIRITGGGAMLTIKGPSRSNVRLEFEYAIPPEDARAMLDGLAVGRPVEKVRYRLAYRGYTWELDVFSGDNDGLVLAEVELESPEVAPDLPDWVGREVSDDPRFYNARLALDPYTAWARHPSLNAE